MRPNKCVSELLACSETATHVAVASRLREAYFVSEIYDVRDPVREKSAARGVLNNNNSEPWPRLPPAIHR